MARRKTQQRKTASTDASQSTAAPLPKRTSKRSREECDAEEPPRMPSIPLPSPTIPFVPRCRCEICNLSGRLAVPALTSSGNTAKVCVDCVRQSVHLCKELLATVSNDLLESALVVLPPVLDDEWMAVISQRRPKHVLWLGGDSTTTPDHRFPPLEGVVTFATSPAPLLVNWLATTQHSTLHTLTLYGAADDSTLDALRPMTNLRVLSLVRCAFITAAGLKHLVALPKLEDLHCVLGNEIGDAGLANLAALKQLRTFIMHTSSKATDTGLALIRSMKQMEILSLFGCSNVSVAALKAVGSLSQLKFLDLSFCSRVTDAALERICDLENLEVLDLGVCFGVGDAGAVHIAKLFRLRALALSGCERITDVALSHLKALDNLEELNVSHCSITDGGMECIGSLSRLRILCIHSCTKVTDNGVAHLGRLVQLHTIQMAGLLHLTDAAFAHLKPLAQLQVLDVGGCTALTGSGLAHLASHSKIQRLALASCFLVNDDALEHLKPMVHLRTLDLSNCPAITDAGVAHLTNLTSLSLQCCSRVSDAGVAHVACSCPNIQWLDLFNCNITDDGLRSLERSKWLEVLNVGGGVSYSDSGVESLATLPHLRQLRVSRSRTTDAAYVRLTERLPQGCECSRW